MRGMGSAIAKLIENTADPKHVTKVVIGAIMVRNIKIWYLAGKKMSSA
jgi:hypothetical protein